MSSARIDLGTGATGGCCAIGIDRTKPAILDPYMPVNDWNTFCDEIDQAFNPMAVAMKISMVATALMFVSFFLVFITGFLRIGNSGAISPFTFTFIPVIFMVLLIGTMCYLSYRSQTTLSEIQKICAETSQRQPSLSFHVRYEYHYYHSSHNNDHHHGESRKTNYIEVSINTTGEVAMGEAEITVEPAVATPVLVDKVDPFIVPATATAPVEDLYSTLESGSKKIPKQRLEDLEKTKDLLTEKEYKEKRKEILADL
mmetsp:Transcript_10322/g.15855  ORF Transcript_10322/g.15855 Transcript_10322/m.15855 type:complete len:256 (+) Transcript_10322:199-966(+)|eukprot:CAMPEP_0178923022 /NCGR_PEP_ID=MMETSP0786-20121207/16488_1 /TAXON_ID=186022 /ORGANISM="Thalassionema frauenfeldii, Strain CCMP 1798" /LENGTH=255 /DNA_ID=CAMNT_0020597471 /DNA_START=193 /DNA_END=960 /DNA_ORIENTATION=+